MKHKFYLPRSKNKILVAAVIGAIGLILAQFSDYNLASITPHQGILEGEVIKVYDGDTITLRAQGKQHKIRLYGLDAPEIAQSFGKESREYLLGLCPLQAKAQVKIKDSDKYGRIVGIVLCPDTKPKNPASKSTNKNYIDVNAALVKHGYAWAYEDYTKAYVPLELYARIHKLGLWAQGNPIRPSVYRRQSKQ